MKNERPWYKNWLVWTAILLIAFIIISVPFVINELYKWGNATGKGYYTEWDAADVLSFYGAILSFLGTVIFSMLALIQNKRLSDENSVAQERLKEISERANELNSINKIIEHEEKRLNELYGCFNIFMDMCDLQTLSALLNNSENLDRAQMLIRISDHAKKLRKIFLDIARNLRIDPNIDDVDASPIKSSVLNLFVTVEESLTILGDRIANNKAIDKTTIDSLFPKIKILHEKFMKSEEAYCRKLEMNLYKTVYEEMSLEEIKKMYRELN